MSQPGTGPPSTGTRAPRPALSWARSAAKPAPGSAAGQRQLPGRAAALARLGRRRVPVLLDGFVSTAAAAPLAVLAPGGLDHVIVSHLSAEAGHRALTDALGQTPLLSLGLRLGEASGAALAIPLLRGALACHAGMATFAQAGVSDRC